jgi:hypothetical protein
MLLYAMITKGSYAEKGVLAVKTSHHASLALLDTMADHVGCTYVSDLKYIDDAQRARLRYKLEGTQPEAASLQEWNDALTYLSGWSAESTREQARQRLIDAMCPPAGGTGGVMA